MVGTELRVSPKPTPNISPQSSPESRFCTYPAMHIATTLKYWEEPGDEATPPRTGRRGSPVFQRATLKYWEEPGDEATPPVPSQLRFVVIAIRVYIHDRAGADDGPGPGDEVRAAVLLRMGYLQQQQMDAGTTRDVADVTPAAPAKVMRGVGTFVLTAKQF